MSLERTRGLLLHANADMELILDALVDLDRAEAVIQAAREIVEDKYPDPPCLHRALENAVRALDGKDA